MIQPQLKNVLIIISFFLATFYLNAYTQTQKPKNTNEYVKYSMSELITEFNKTPRTDSILKSNLLEKIKIEIEKTDVLKDKALGYFAISGWDRMMGNYKEAIQQTNKTIKIAKEIKDDTLLMRGKIRSGALHYNMGAHQKALEEYLKALEIAKQLNKTERQQVIYHNISFIKLAVEDYEGAIEILHKGLQDAEQDKNIKSKSVYASIHTALCNAYISIKDYENARIYCEKSIQLSEQYDYVKNKAYALINKGNLEISIGNYDKGLDILDQAIAIAKDFGEFGNQFSIIQLHQAKGYFHKKEFKKAIEYLHKIEELKEKNGFDFLALQEMYSLLAKSYNALNDTEKANNYFQKAIETNVANDKEKTAITRAIIKKYNLSELQDKLEVSNTTAKNTKYLLYLSLIAILIIILGFAVFHKKQKKRNKKKFDALIKELNTKNDKVIVKEPAATILEEKAAVVLKKLDKFEEKKLFLNEKSTLKDVADSIKTNTSYLSKTVNAHKKKSFSNYITDLRVDYAIKRIKEDKKFRSYTIEAIAKEIGFKRSESFSKAFKQKTGLYPSYFIKELKKGEAIE